MAPGDISAQAKVQFVDKPIECIGVPDDPCGKIFIWSAGEQRYFERHNIKHMPRRCKECRDKWHKHPLYLGKKGGQYDRLANNTTGPTAGNTSPDATISAGNKPASGTGRTSPTG